MIKFPEVALVCGTALVIASHSALGGTFMGLSVLASFIKWTVTLQEAQKAKQAQEVFLNGISGVISEFLASKGIMYAATDRNNSSLH